MRTALAGWAGLLVAGTTWAVDIRSLDDAALRAVHFVDRNEGWVCGDDGVILHSIDGGATWERQPTGCRASLRAIHFLTPYTGWVVGREELPGGVSVGVLLTTTDGGLKWQRIARNVLPGLHAVRFFTDQSGLVAGEGTDRHPGGVFLTSDGGRTWKPLPGPRGAGWLAADLSDAQTGILAGAWGRLATLRNGLLGTTDLDPLAGRTLHAVRLNGSRAVAVGEGGLVLLSSDSAGVRWGFANLGQPTAVLADCDFHGVQMLDSHIWICGRPGSVIWHSADRGQRWQRLITGQPVPLHAVTFIDDRRGWAVGELGTILSTTDGGQSWERRRQGGRRVALLTAQAHSADVPFEVLYLLGAGDGYLTHALRLMAPSAREADPRTATEPERLTAAVRQVGGAVAESLGRFPVPSHLAGTDTQQLIAHWDGLHHSRAGEVLLRQAVLALRIWQPEVVLIPDETSSQPAQALTARAFTEAVRRAADPKAFPEQVETLGLAPWTVRKLYAASAQREGSAVTLSLTEPVSGLSESPGEAAQLALSLLPANPSVATQRFYRLVSSPDATAKDHRQLMTGTALAFGGTARRSEPSGVDADLAVTLAAQRKVAEKRRNLRELLAQTDRQTLAKPEWVLGQLTAWLDEMPPDQAAPAAFAAARQLADAGQWVLAREAFLVVTNKYPAHPLAAQAYRWLVQYHASSEARRRQELGQFVVLSETTFQQVRGETDGGHVTQAVHTERPFLLRDREAARRWYEGSLTVEPRLAAFGPVLVGEPQVQFCLQSSRRHLGQAEAASRWYGQFLAEAGGVETRPKGDVWREAAAAEMWLLNRNGPPPRPLIQCKHSDMRPFLDGQLDDACWQSAQPLTCRDAVGDTAAQSATQAWLAYDREFLYFAARCRHPKKSPVQPIRSRRHDADLSRFDRVTLMLDLDRDFQTCYCFHIDERGAVADDCWGDRSWNPKWYVAVSARDEEWCVEAAIPMTELTGEAPSLGKTWAGNVTRVLPGRGVQAWSLPAGTVPQPEGLGFVVFSDERRTTGERSGSAP